VVLTNERPILSLISRKMADCYWLAAINDQQPLSMTTTSEKKNNQIDPIQQFSMAQSDEEETSTCIHCWSVDNHRRPRHYNDTVSIGLIGISRSQRF